MFTGLIEEVGTVRSLERRQDFQRLEVAAETVLADTAVGDSISVNGVCQTVTERGAESFWVESVAETLARTTLGDLREADAVNLERSLRAGDRIGGHMVLGHVDDVGEIRRFETPTGADNWVLEIDVPAGLRRFVATKGSIAVDGISLTVVDVLPESFTVAIIPHTFRHTNLSQRRAGAGVNLEIDVLARYVARLLETAGDAGSSADPTGVGSAPDITRLLRDDSSP